MKDIKIFINESAEKQMWCAVSIAYAADDMHPHNTYSERVVSWDTYQKLRNGESKGYREIMNIDLLGKSTDKNEAEAFLNKSPKTVRKTSIKTNANYIVYCISSGPFKASGKTNWDWSIFDEEISKDSEIFGNRWGAIYFGAKGSLKVGDTVCGVDNDTLKKLSGAPDKIEFVCPCTYDAFVKEYRDKFPTYCKRPSYQFGKKSDGLPWSRMGQMYSIKGIEDVNKINKGEDTAVGPANDEGKATAAKEKALKVEAPKEVKSEKPSIKWRITYDQLTPMGTDSHHIYTHDVYAKTKKGAEGVYKREIRRGPDSAYATTLLKIEPIQ